MVGEPGHGGPAAGVSVSRTAFSSGVNGHSSPYPNTTSTAILSLIASGTARTRIAIARNLGMSASTVTARVTELERAGLVEDAGAVSATSGRPARLLRLTPKPGVLRCAAISRFHTRAAILDLTGQPLRVTEVRSDIAAGPEGVLTRLATLWDELDPGGELGPIHGAGVSLPGPVDSDTASLVATAGMPGWSELDLAGWLRQHTGAPAVVENDANACALGEFALRTARGEHRTARNLLFVKASSHLGAGLIIDGRIHRGASWVGGDFATSPIADLRRADPSATGFDALTVVRRADAGQQQARDRLHDAGTRLGQTLAMLVNFVNPEVVAIGGALSASAAFCDAVAESLRAHCHPLATTALRIEPTIAGPDAGVIGVGHLVLRRVIAELQR